MTDTASKFDPLESWFKIPPAEQPPNHYRLLGIGLYESDRAVIDDAVEQRATFLQDITDGPNIADAQKILNDVAAARVCLMDPALKQEYDSALKAHLENPVKASTAFEFVVDKKKLARRKAPKAKYDTNTLLLYGGASLACLALVCVVAFLKFGLSGDDDTPVQVDSAPKTTKSVTKRKSIDSGAREVQKVTKAVPVLHWNFEGKDPAIGSSPARISNIDFPAVNGEEASGRFMSFNGKSTALRVPEKILKASGGAVSFFVRFPRNNGTVWLMDSKGKDAKDQKMLRLTIRLKNDKTFYVSATCDPNGGHVAIHNSKKDVTPNKWTHFAITWGNLENSCFYIDGNLVGETATSIQNANDPQRLVLGLKTTSSKKTFAKMDLDDFRIYDVRLGHNQVKKIYLEDKK